MWYHLDGSLQRHCEMKLYSLPEVTEQKGLLTKNVWITQIIKLIENTVRRKRNLLELRDRVWVGWKDHSTWILRYAVFMSPVFLSYHISLPHWWFSYRTRVEVWAQGPTNRKCPGQEHTLTLLERCRDKYTRPIASCSLPINLLSINELQPRAGREHMEPEWVSSVYNWIMASWILITFVYLVHPEYWVPYRSLGYIYSVH